MEKLIELLNEYEKEITLIPVCWDYSKDKIWYGSLIPQVSKTYLISNHYGFIKWLVDNVKIKDFTLCAIDKKNDFTEREIQEEYESLLMLLAIQDKPIQFLVDILK